jgi:prolyl oligopeptidase
MRHFIFGVITLGIAMMNTTTQAQKNKNIPKVEDAYLWLEDVSSQKSLDWVRAKNKVTLDVLEASPNFELTRNKAFAILSDKNRIAYATIQGERVTNFWQDETAVRGMWRSASLKSYLAGKPEWTPLLDLDALAKAENKNWVWKGAKCLAPKYNHCMISLSDGGKDAVEMREFDIETASFVKDGFSIPQAKNNVAWWDENTLIIGTDYGPNSMTESGYPRTVKKWQRSTPLTSAILLFEGAQKDISVSAIVNHDNGRHDRMILRGKTFWTNEIFHINKKEALIKSPLPDDVDIKDVSNGWVFAVLRKDYQGIPRGSLVTYAIDTLLRTGTAPLETVYTPTAGVSIDDVSAAKSKIYVSVLDNVTGKLKTFSRTKKSWTEQNIALPANGTLSIVSVASTSDLALVNFQSFTTPSSLYAMSDAAPYIIAALPARIDVARYETLQKFATSVDGTKIPYFIVRPKSIGPLPTLLYGYGGFEVSSKPAYVGPLAQFWLEGGGAYVVANIRGGGEYGPDWHQAALKQNRQRAYDDFHAVAEDLIKSGATTAKQLGIQGGSNGGLLVSVAYTQRPELYGAVICQVPLADMKRYHLLLAGASWVDEYGNPDIADEWAYISKYSPYQNIKKDVKYPKVFFTTSTKDDRVHPAHARKMAARMSDYNHPIYYYENIDGGHAGVANLKESAYRTALFIAYLNKELRSPSK